MTGQFYRCLCDCIYLKRKPGSRLYRMEAFVEEAFCQKDPASIFRNEKSGERQTKLPSPFCNYPLGDFYSRRSPRPG